MTAQERQTLQRMYRDAREDEISFHLGGYSGKEIAANDAMWVKIDDYCSAHAITTEEYWAAVRPMEEMIYESTRRALPDLSVLALEQVVGYVPMPFFPVNTEIREALQTLCRRDFEQHQR